MARRSSVREAMASAREVCAGKSAGRWSGRTIGWKTTRHKKTRLRYVKHMGKVSHGLKDRFDMVTTWEKLPVGVKNILLWDKLAMVKSWGP